MQPPYTPLPVRSEVDRALTFWIEIERATGRLPYPMTESPRDGVPRGDWLYEVRRLEKCTDGAIVLLAP